MAKAKTESGFSYEIVKDYKDDFEFVEILREYEENPLRIIDVVKYLLGDKGYQKLRAFSSDENGKVSTQKFSETALAILDSENDLKK